MKEREGKKLTMTDQLYSLLLKDESLFHHPLRLKGMLLDCCPKEERRDIFLLFFLLQCGVVKTLSKNEYSRMLEDKIVSQMYNAYGFERDLIRKNMRTWAKVLHHLIIAKKGIQHFYFQDPQLEEAVKASVYKEKGQPLTDEDFHSLVVLRGDNFQITSLKGIEKLVNVEHISLQKNQIADITPLLFLKKLKTLFISENEIREMDIINDFDTLQNVDFSYNPIVDLEKLSDRSLMLMFDTIGEDISLKARVYSLLVERGYSQLINEGGKAY